MDKLTKRVLEFVDRVNCTGAIYNAHSRQFVKDAQELITQSNTPKSSSRWRRNEPYIPDLGPYIAYEVLYVTNTKNEHPDHPPQVVYQGDNGFIWSLPLRDWPKNLVPEKNLYLFHTYGPRGNTANANSNP